MRRGGGGGRGQGGGGGRQGRREARQREGKKEMRTRERKRGHAGGETGSAVAPRKIGTWALGLPRRGCLAAPLWGGTARGNSSPMIRWHFLGGGGGCRLNCLARPGGREAGVDNGSMPNGSEPRGPTWRERTVRAGQPRPKDPALGRGPVSLLKPRASTDRSGSRARSSLGRRPRRREEKKDQKGDEGEKEEV